MNWEDIMKRILSFILVLTAVVLLSSCKLAPENFTFNSHHFGNTMEQVKSSENDNGKIDEVPDDYQVLRYSNVKFVGCTGNADYYFKGNVLRHIYFTDVSGPAWNEKQEETNKRAEELYQNAKEVLSDIYGEPNKETKSDEVYKALWKKRDYGIILLVSEKGVQMGFSWNPDKSEKFYKNGYLTELFDD